MQLRTEVEAQHEKQASAAEEMAQLKASCEALRSNKEESLLGMKTRIMQDIHTARTEALAQSQSHLQHLAEKGSETYVSRNDLAEAIEEGKKRMNAVLRTALTSKAKPGNLDAGRLEASAATSSGHTENSEQAKDCKA